MPEPIHESIKSTFRYTFQIGVFFETPAPARSFSGASKVEKWWSHQILYIYNEDAKLQREEAPGLDSGKVTVRVFWGLNLVFLPK